MTFSISALGFERVRLAGMQALDKELGIELFLDRMAEPWHCEALPQILKGRTGRISFHAPFRDIDMSADGEDETILRQMIETLPLCSLYGADEMVVHTNEPFPWALSPEEGIARRMRAARRLTLLHDIATAQGINILVENLGVGGGMTHLYSQEQFLQIFVDHPALPCIIDVGHALCESYDIFQIQKALGPRIKAYHLHDNDGKNDCHLRLGEGILNIHRLMEGIRQYTPDATLVFEYGDLPDAKAYLQDIDILLRA